MSKLDDLQKLCDAATKGPWHPTTIRRMQGESHTVDDDEQSICKVLSNKPVDDKYFISTARTEMPKLIDRVRNLEGFVDFILTQERTLGYPTGSEWTSIVEVAKNEKLKIRKGNEVTIEN